MRYLTVNTPEQHMHRSFTPFGWLLPPMCLLLAGLLLSCERDEASAPPLSDYERGFRDSLDAVAADYAELRLWEALAGARRLRARVDAAPDSLRGELRAELYQYLAMLHFDRHYHRDSVGTYVELAESHIGPDGPTILTARQALVKAYRSYIDWAYLEMWMHAEYGKQLLADSDTTHGLLHGLLLVIQGRGVKKHGDKLTEEWRKIEWWDRSEQYLNTAVAYFKSRGSPWVAYARNQLAIQLTRRPEDDALLLTVVDSLAGDAKGRPAVFAYPDYILGYWYWHRDAPDSAAHHLRLLLNERPFFFSQMENVAYFLLLRHAEGKQDYSQAIDLLRDEMQAVGCCPIGQDELLKCNRENFCYYYPNTIAKQHLKLYGSTGNPEHLQRAYQLSQVAFNRFIGTFASDEEEAALNKSRVEVDRLISTTLEIAAEMSSVHPSDEHYEAVFAAMEVGKAYFLRRELLDRKNERSSEEETVAHPKVVEYDTEIKGIKALLDSEIFLTAAELVRYQQLDRLRRNYRSKNLDGVTHRNSPDGQLLEPQQDKAIEGLSLATVRTRLGPDEGLIELAEANRTLYALYTDTDTTIVYRTSLDSIEDNIEEFRGLFAKSSIPPVTTFQPVAHDLFLRLIQPVAHRTAVCSTLLIVPGPLLATLPFAALVVEHKELNGTATYQDLSYLSNRCGLRYLDSWRTYVEQEALREKSWGGVEKRNYSAAVWTHSELGSYLGNIPGGNLTRFAQQVDHYTGSALSPEMFLNRLPAYDILHLSVHAENNASRLHDNHLFIAPGEQLNGLLIDATQFNAKLVVLAACSTAKGQHLRREGVYSLRRSFHLAGVPDVVASLYDIPAAATAVLLDAFYLELSRSKNVAGALVKVQRAARAGQFGPRYAYPGYWGGYILG
jgi:CHAT domain-containing protein